MSNLAGLDARASRAFQDRRGLGLMGAARSHTVVAGTVAHTGNAGQPARTNQGAAGGRQQRPRQPLVELLGREELGLRKDVLRQDREDERQWIDEYGDGRVTETVLDEEGRDGANERQRGDRLPIHLQQMIGVAAEKAHGPCPLGEARCGPVSGPERPFRHVRR